MSSQLVIVMKYQILMGLESVHGSVKSSILMIKGETLNGGTILKIQNFDGGALNRIQDKSFLRNYLLREAGNDKIHQILKVKRVTIQ